MPCFTSAVVSGQILMNVLIAAPGGDENVPVAVDDENAFRALVDTGATVSCISKRAAQKAGVKPLSKVRIQTAGGAVRLNTYCVDLHIPVGVGVTKKKEQIFNVRNFVNKQVSEVLAPGPFDVILGMDVITAGSGLHVSGNSFTFCT